MQLEFWGGIKTLPWIIKPVYGILSDAVPLLGYHRRSYLIIFGLMGERQNSADLSKQVYSKRLLRTSFTPLLVLTL